MATGVLEGDIKGCFDNISQGWMLRNIVMDKVVLHKGLKAGYVENGTTYPTRKGTPQGGIISPTLSNMTLDGMEEAVRGTVPRRSRVNFVRYADEFIITGKSKRRLEKQIKPAVEGFLAEGGLTLSKQKTVITYIKRGFTFLGQTFRKHVSAPMPILIKKLNETLRSWGNYHRHGVASDAFGRIDTYVFEQLGRILRREQIERLADQTIRVGFRSKTPVRRTGQNRLRPKNGL